MLQRVQTVYMFLVFIALGVLPFVFPLWYDGDGKEIYFMFMPSTMILFLACTMLTVISILSFKNRKNQFVLNRLNMILNVILLGLFVYRTLSVSGEATDIVSEKGIGMFLPIVSIPLLVLANKAIKKDEDLVKSVDRIR